MSINPPLNRKLRMALVGGGGQAFIGPVHAIAATMDHRAELVAGALSSDPERSRTAALDYGIAADRAYGSYEELLAREAEIDESQRVDFVSIATPNYLHFPIARDALRTGLDVICDKPMTIRLDEAAQLAELVRETGAVFAVTHNYSGYPLVRQAREMVRGGEIGEIQGVRVNYVQGWLRGAQPDARPARGAWKEDPQKAGSGSLGDIATHAYHLARYITGLKTESLSALLKTFAPGRDLEDYGHILLRFDNDAVGMITFSQVTHGRLNDLWIEIDGDRGSLSWHQEEPNTLALRRFGEPVRTYERHPAAPYTADLSRAASRIPGGHPEGFFEAFANVYRSAFDEMVQRKAGARTDSDSAVYPTVDDGVEGVRLILHCQESNRNGSSWVDWNAD